MLYVFAMALSWYLCVFAVICAQLSPVTPRRGSLKPDDPVVAVGGRLSLYCSLSKPFLQKNTHINASSIIFTLASKQIPSQYVMVLSRRVAVVTYPMVDTRHNEQYVCCAIAGTRKEISCQYLYVGYPPYKPTVTSINILKKPNTRRLTFSWTVEENKIYTTTYRGLWKTTDMSEFEPCQYREFQYSSCYVQNCKLDKVYMIKVVGTNIVGNVTSEEVRINPRNLVKPAKVVVQTRADNASCVTVTWRSPEPDHQLLYELSYLSRWGGANQSIVSMLDQLHVQVCSLVPHTEHVFALRAKFKTFGLWNEPTTHHQRTLTSIPGSGAEVTKGGFDMTEVTGHARKVRVYWKPVPDRLQNGDIQGYKITCMSPPNISTSFVGPERTWASLGLLDNDHFYHIFVDAKTSAGYNEQRRQSMISVGTVAQMPAASENFTVFAMNETSVHIEWTFNPNVAGYTLYWCQGSQNDFTCVSELEWHTLPTRVSNFTIELLANHSYREYLFGISVETDHASSGIVWSTCIYEHGKVSAPPRVKLKECNSHSLEFSLEKPSCAESRGYITGYNIYYCQLNDMEICVAKEIRTYIPGNKATHHTLQGLWPQQKYRIVVQSVSAAGVSHAVVLEAVTSQSRELSATMIFLIVAVGFVAVIFCIIGLGYVCKAPKNVRNWMKLSIKPPQKNQSSLRNDKDLEVAESFVEEHPSDSRAGSFPRLSQHVTADTGNDQAAEFSVNKSQPQEDTDSDNDTGYTATRQQVVPLVFNPVDSSHKVRSLNFCEDVDNCSNASVSLLSSKRLRDTPNNLCDDSDVDSSDNDDGYCKGVVSNFHHIAAPNICISDISDDDNVCGNSTRASPISCPIDTSRRDVSDVSNIDDNDICGYSKVVTSPTHSSDIPDRHVNNTDSSSSDDDCGYSRVVTSTTHSSDIPSRHVSDTDGSDNDDDGYSKMVTSTTSPGDTPIRHLNDTDGPDSDDQDDITGYSKVIPNMH